MILTYKEIQRMKRFSEQHDKCNIYVRYVPTSLCSTTYIQTQQDCIDRKNNLLDITNDDNL